MRAGIAVAAALALGGCMSPPPESAAHTGASGAPRGIMLTTDRQTYAAGEDVTLILRNETGYELGHNMCSDSVLERREDGHWVEESLEPRDPCTALLALMPPGGTAAQAFLLHPQLPEGEYRFRTSLEHMGSGERRPHHSTGFRIAR